VNTDIVLRIRYALVTNANPSTGFPCVLGELAQNFDELNTFGKSWHKLQTIPISKLIGKKPDLYQQIVNLVQSRKLPTRFLFRLHIQELELMEEQPLNLVDTSALHYFYELLRKGDIDSEKFLQAIAPDTLIQQQAYLNSERNNHLILEAQGISISGGVAKGVLTKSLRDLESQLACELYSILLVDRIEAQHTVLLNSSGCAGVLALRGSPADHFALLSREKNFPYMVLESCQMSDQGLLCSDKTLPFGSFVTVNFQNGKLYLGDGVIQWRVDNPAILTVQKLLSERVSPYPLRLNLDTVDDLTASLPADASGIGLVRTEHLLRRNNKQEILRQFLETDSLEVRNEALEDLSSFFKTQFLRFMALAKGLPVTIRLLDYPLHELGCSLLTEVNPMMGLRGVRQGIKHPALYQVQIEAILTATIEAQEQGIKVNCLEILIPLVSFIEEVKIIRLWIEQCQNDLSISNDLTIKLGTMVETPAAVLSCDTLAKECDFLSFGTNDLTQLVLGLSREDYLPILQSYQQQDILKDDPFQTLHPVVFQFIHNAAIQAKQANPQVLIGICGIHAAQPQILELCKDGLVDYLSVPQHQLHRVKLQAIQSLKLNGE
jgi:pyruvate, orthophosphate dikinase